MERAKEADDVTRTSHLQRTSRPWIAMAAAYAVALQMLLSAAVASQMAAAKSADALPFCFGTSQTAGGPDKGDLVPVHQAACVFCTVGFSAPVDLAAAVVEHAVDWIDIVRPRPASEPVLPQAPPSPRRSQGPPQIA
jgi:hypothetical protein